MHQAVTLHRCRGQNINDTSSDGDSALLFAGVRQIRIRAPVPRRVALQPLPQHLLRPTPSAAATTVANRPQSDVALSSSPFDLAAIKRNVGKRPPTTHEHFEVRVQWYTPSGNGSANGGSMKDGSTTRRSCGDVCVASCSSRAVALVSNPN
jgi:hypothetical protein